MTCLGLGTETFLVSVLVPVTGRPKISSLKKSLPLARLHSKVLVQSESLGLGLDLMRPI